MTQSLTDPKSWWILGSYMTRDWIRSRPASVLFAAAAAICLVVSPFLWWNLPIRIEDSPLPIRLVFAISPLAMIFLWQGMWQYWLAIDDGPPDRKKLWFLVLLFLFWIGSLIYFVLVYLPRVCFRDDRFHENG